MVNRIIRPKDVKSDEELCRMQSDNFPQDSKKWSILVSENHISLHQPLGGAWVEIPKEDFDKIVEWYTKPQSMRKS